MTLKNQKREGGKKGVAWVSKCCGAEVNVVGEETKHYECSRCGKPCDAERISYSANVPITVSVNSNHKRMDKRNKTKTPHGISPSVGVDKKIIHRCPDCGSPDIHLFACPKYNPDVDVVTTSTQGGNEEWERMGWRLDNRNACLKTRIA